MYLVEHLLTFAPVCYAWIIIIDMIFVFCISIPDGRTLDSGWPVTDVKFIDVLSTFPTGGLNYLGYFLCV